MNLSSLLAEASAMRCAFCGAIMIDGECPVLTEAGKRFNLSVDELSSFEGSFEGSLTSRTGAKLRQLVIENEEILEEHGK